MKKIDRRIRSMWKAVFFIVCGGMNITSCVDMDLSPNGSPSDSNVWSTASLAEQTVAGVYNQLYVEYSDVANGWFMELVSPRHSISYLERTLPARKKEAWYSGNGIIKVLLRLMM